MIYLDVEVDFSQVKGMVTLRFFEKFEDGRRMPVRMQRLYNLAVQCRKSPEPFRPDDRELLKRLAKDLAKPSVLGKNLEILVITQSQWNSLRTGSLAQRFRDKQSGAIYSDKLPKAMVYFELACHGDKTLFSCVVDLPDGEKLDWHKVKDHLRQRRTNSGAIQFELVMDNILAELDLPVELDLLNRIFGLDNQRIPTDAVAGSLPILIEHRLDRLRGPSVQRQSGRAEGRLRLTAEGADIILTPMAGDVPLRFGQAAASTLKRKGDSFIVSENRCSHFNALRALINGLPLVEQPDGTFKLAGHMENMAALSKALQTLPPSMGVERDDELTYLTGKPLAVQTAVNAREMPGWFEYDIECMVGNLPISGDDLMRAARRNTSIIRTRDGYWLTIDEADLQQAAGQLAEINESRSNHRLSTQFTEFMDLLSRMPNLTLRRGAKELVESVRSRPEPQPLQLPKTIDALLRPYQREGIEFLYNRSCWQLGSLLADDMGLGKTIQVLSALSALRTAGQVVSDALVVCPASVIFVWQAEAKKFFPELKVVLLNGGPEERQSVLTGGGFDIAVCSYAVMRNDLEQLNEHGFALAILDEAQYIRNSGAQVSMAARALNAERRLALTGTPLENRLNDLWSIMEFLNPGYLGTEKEFEAVYQGEDLSKLRQKISPIMMRRRKGEVARDLPPRTEETITIPFTPDQAEFYQAQLVAARQRISGQNSMQILAALTRLRQVCCHPALIDDTTEVESAKLTYLIEMVLEILDEGHSVLVFSQFTSMLEIIRQTLAEHTIVPRVLTGETSGKKRKEMVEAFAAADDPEVFLLSLKAAGTGLTLTKADYVIIYDPWWNPAAESQAIDRTHRIGQDKPVMAYRLVVSGSIEEKILALQDEKRALFQSAVDDAVSAPSKITADELAHLLG